MTHENTMLVCATKRDVWPLFTNHTD